ncbi:LysR family transcriptional regulator [Sphingomonas sp. OTU376]|uniref:LysR family transcriptional regulator n=1 Tax=Sphingomonas sp. OTU376 TaxID=3043863 RepID=UPI00313C815B
MPHPELDLALLRTLRTLLEERNVTRTSRRLGISQPALSGRLAKLRRILGDPLFVPSTSARGVVPTPRAEAIQSEVVALIEAMDGLMRGGGFDPGVTTRTFTIACLETPAAVLAPVLVPAFRTLAPRARLSFVATGPDAAQDLETGRTDLLLSGADEAAGELLHRLAWRDRYASARAPGPGGPLDLDAFCMAAHVVVASSGDGLSTVIDERLETLGRRRSVAATVQSYAIAAMLAAQDGYLCTLPRRFLSRFADCLDIVEPPLDLPELAISMIWHPRMQADAGHVWLRDLVLELMPKA